MSAFFSQYASLFATISAAAGQPVALVGGAVRDAMLGRESHDLDFVLERDARAVGKKVANALGGGFYMLDAARDTARVILSAADGGRLFLDFATYRGDCLDADLRDRDFTINAMALDLASETLVDPTGGAEDLRLRRLRLCSPRGLVSDPARVLRAVRFALRLNLKILPETSAALREAAGLLERISPERRRDELFRILEGGRVDSAMRLLDHFGALPGVLPELQGLKGVEQSAPHIYDVWEHTLSVARELETVLAVLVDEDAGGAADIHASTLLLFLRPYRAQLREHMRALLSAGRTPRGLLFLAALYHDISKPEKRTVEVSGRVRFLEHEHAGARVVEERARALALSTPEVQRVTGVVNHHMRVHHLAAAPLPPTRRAVYRFFKATGAAGPEIVLLSLADVLGTYGPTLGQQTLENELIAARTLLDGLWQTPQEVVRPQRLLNGSDLQKIFRLQPGREIGQLLEEMEEAQAVGDITGREEALRFVENRLKQMKLREE